MKVLLVGHDASRTGTPRLVGSLARWLAGQGHEPHIALDHGGPLLASLEAVAPTAVVDPGSGRSPAEWAALGLGEVGLGGVADQARLVRRRRALRAAGTSDVVWLHGAASLRWLPALPEGVPVVAHIHELAVGIDRSLAGTDPAALLGRADLVVAVSGAVAHHLVTERGVDPQRVRVHHGWIPEPAVAAPAARRPADVPDGALLVGGCGTAGWRKGSDLFVMAAQLAPAEVAGRPLHWVWVGGGTEADLGGLRREVAARGVGDRVHVVGEQPDPERWMAGFDVLALTSREEPFSLVTLEAGAAGVPVVSFASGGIAELMRGLPGTDGLVADLLDVEALAGAITALAADADRRRTVGEALQARVADRHTAERAIPPLWADVGALAHP